MVDMLNLRVAIEIRADAWIIVQRGGAIADGAASGRRAGFEARQQAENRRVDRTTRVR
ncbi:MAG: hypothetical protein ABSG76_26705 [Xanthobacteraceae bacterium]|jgi:hypothetical protein